jgi:hypothetical protein
MSTQLAPQAIDGRAQLVAHVPPLQTWLAPQARPQPPQFAASAVTSTHLPAQDVVPVRHVQTPSAHAEPGPHTTPQAPQFDVSLSMDTHTPPHSNRPAGQTHFENAHERPPPHTTPQAPQLAESRVRSTQLWPHAEYGGVQPPTHAPAWQKAAALGQALPQAPQFRGSLASERQTPSQRIVPVGQAHAPEMHDPPPPQTRSQLPQWFGSVAVSTHSAPQLVCPGAVQLQPPLRQVWPGPHRFPQPPQFAESLRRSAHVSPQASSPAPQGAGPSGLTSRCGCASGLTSGCPPSQLAPEQGDIDAPGQGSPSAQRFNPVRPQPTTATSQIPSNASRRGGMPTYSR